jgi:hypothetical protein
VVLGCLVPSFIGAFLVTFALFGFLALSGAGLQGFQSPFPVARAEPEFRKILEHAISYAHMVENDERGFLAGVAPYGPIALTVSGDVTNDERRTLRNFYFGVAGRAAQIDPVKMTDSFHCGPDCIEHRKEMVWPYMAEVERLVSKFRDLRAVRLVSQWGLQDEYRVNDAFQMLGRVNEGKPTDKMGFLPSDVWRPWRSMDDYVRSIGGEPAAVKNLISGMRKIGFLAIVTDSTFGIRAIRFGMANNESGLMYSVGGRSTPRLGMEDGMGAKFVVVERVHDGLVYYETN